MKSRLVLVGFMGSGKSTLGPLLARRLGWTFVDMDPRVEERLGLGIPEAFEKLGERAFREQEEEVARELLSSDRTVVASGGGAFAQARTRELLRAGSLSVWLRAPLEVLLARMGSVSGRPLASNRETIRALFAEREPLYGLADQVVEVADCDVEEVARRVFEVVEACRNESSGEGGTG